MARGNGGGRRRGRAWHRAQWRAHVDAWLDSGLSGAAYCRRHGLRPKNLYRWRRVFSAQQDDGNGMHASCVAPAPMSPEALCTAAAPVGSTPARKAAPPMSVKSRPTRSPGPLFAELRMASSMSQGSVVALDAASLALSSLSSGVEVVLAGERRLRIARGFDAVTLSEVVRVLEGLGAAEPHGC